MEVRILVEDQIKRLIDRRGALEAVRAAFVALDGGLAILPPPTELDVPARHGEVHVKGAYLLGNPFFAFKVATGFYDNLSLGLPVTGGLSIVFDANTGLLTGLLFDNGWLTEVRTGAAGALATDLLAVKQPQQVGILGTGGQARHQLESLVEVRHAKRIVAYGRTRDRALEFVRDMKERCNIDVELVASAREAVEGSQIVVTTTPARQPVVMAEWVAPGTHITAIGSDMPEKQELDPAILIQANRVVADSLEQCLRSGEIHHAAETSSFTGGNVYAELGELASGRKGGRTGAEEITVADLTGLGIEDASLANLVMTRSIAAGVGQLIEI
ncbi:MAG: ornithine cyclodeaminase family protein [Candidatus Nephthysia bennettiae]|nr:MAG: ornithine cyclodeaminase family protein [Candidatus Dormibacteraeota bacterium]